MLKALFLSDIHLLGYGDSFFINTRREWQMYRAFKTIINLHHPDVVFVLGECWVQYILHNSVICTRRPQTRLPGLALGSSLAVYRYRLMLLMCSEDGLRTQISIIVFLSNNRRFATRISVIGRKLSR